MSNTTHIKCGTPDQYYLSFEVKKIPLWIRFCLWFIKPKIAADFANPKQFIVWKRFRGVIYVVGESK